MTRTTIVALLRLIHQYSVGRTNGSRWWWARPNHRRILTSEWLVSHPIRASSLRNGPFCAFLIGNTIAPHVSMAVTGPTLSDVVQDIGRSFDGNRDGAIKGAEKWAFLHEISSRMAPLIEQGAASIAGSVAGAAGTVGGSTGLGEFAPVGTSADQHRPQYSQLARYEHQRLGPDVDDYGRFDRFSADQHRAHQSRSVARHHSRWHGCRRQPLDLRQGRRSVAGRNV